MDRMREERKREQKSDKRRVMELRGMETEGGMKRWMTLDASTRVKAQRFTPRLTLSWDMAYRHGHRITSLASEGDLLSDKSSRHFGRLGKAFEEEGEERQQEAGVEQELPHSRTEDENSTFVYATVNVELVWKERGRRKGHIDIRQMAISPYSPGYCRVRWETIGLDYYMKVPEGK
ncbi:hypothetical protein GBF38_015002 [Nibea albiflora]|uniref:Uncharacterized protein n=1 Tax=Nibea albiflora TaxID=240163 RepID=A0ACB7EKH8_NIBAL|nr:hypothetical protein GBF38_015002 [Nibea albiflora]